MKLISSFILVAVGLIASVGYSQPIRQSFYLETDLSENILQKVILPNLIDSFEHILSSTYNCKRVVIHTALDLRRTPNIIYLDIGAECDPSSVKSLQILAKGFKTTNINQNQRVTDTPAYREIRKSITVTFKVIQQSGRTQQHILSYW